MMEPFDLESVYDEKISPLMAQIIAICKQHKLPMMATFLYEHGGEKGDGFCTTAVPRGDWQHPHISEAVRVVMSEPSLLAMRITGGQKP